MSRYLKIYFLAYSLLTISSSGICASREVILRDSVIKLNQRLSDLQDQVKTGKDLEVKLSESEVMIEGLNRLVGIYGDWFTVIGIFIAAIAILLPLITYVLAIRPSLKARKKLNVRIKKYFQERKNEEVEQALEMLDKGDGMEKQLAAKVLENNYYYPYSNIQLLRVWTLLEEQKIYPANIGLYTLTRKTNDYADKYFMRNNFRGRPPISDAIRYFRKGQMIDYWNTLDNLILNGEGDFREISFNDALSAFSSMSKEDFIKLSNRQELIDQLSERQLKNLASNWNQKITSWNVPGINETYLVKKLSGFLNNG